MSHTSQTDPRRRRKSASFTPHDLTAITSTNNRILKSRQQTLSGIVEIIVSIDAPLGAHALPAAKELSFGIGPRGVCFLACCAVVGDLTSVTSQPRQLHNSTLEGGIGSQHRRSNLRGHLPEGLDEMRLADLRRRTVFFQGTNGRFSAQSHNLSACSQPRHM